MNYQTFFPLSLSKLNKLKKKLNYSKKNWTIKLKWKLNNNLVIKILKKHYNKNYPTMVNRMMKNNKNKTLSPMKIYL